MPITITMPRLSDTMQEGTLNHWHVKVGDKVKSGDVLADVETDKATMELQSFDDGTVAALTVPEGQVAAVGALILVLATEGESIETAAQAAQAGAGAPTTTKESAVEQDHASGGVATMAAPTATVATERPRVSPLARKIAEEQGLDLSQVQGSGPGGRVVKRDLVAASSGATHAPAATTTAPVTAAPATAMAPAVAPMKLENKLVALSSMRKTIARRLVESKTTIPHFTVTTTVAMDALLALRSTLNKQLESQGLKLSVNDFVVRAAALACVYHPVVNSSWTEQGVQLHGSVHVGVAVALPQDKGGGLVVPVLRDAQNLGLRAIHTQSKALSEKARGKGLAAQDMADGTFTISNLGMFGVDHFEAIINPPQAAILAVGAALQKPVVRDGQIVVGSEMTCTLSADHRVIDGATAAQYLVTLRQLLESPAGLLV